jgi:methylenetetrahydrofolate dehydrogenase (NADP+)/methenyltetrahydrofolate cyclohydrolase
VLVGEDPASQVYVRSKRRYLRRPRIARLLPRPARQRHREAPAHPHREAQRDPKVHGILVQVPLPMHMDEQRVLNAISPDKDVDGFHP